MIDTRVDEDGGIVARARGRHRPPRLGGGRPRAMARRRRRQVDEWSDAEFIDNIDYTLFPNFHPWGAYNRIVYRFRPNGDNHREAIMEVFLLAPFKGERPMPAKTTYLGPDDSWTDGTRARHARQDLRAGQLQHAEGAEGPRADAQSLGSRWPTTRRARCAGSTNSSASGWRAEMLGQRHPFGEGALRTGRQRQRPCRPTAIAPACSSPTAAGSKATSTRPIRRCATGSPARRSDTTDYRWM